MLDVISTGVDAINGLGVIIPAGVEGTTDGTTWNWSWTPDATLQEWMRKIAFAIGVLWVGYVLFQFALPKKGGAGKGIKPVNLVLVLGLIIVLCNLTLVPTIINFAGKLLYLGLKTLGWVD